MLKLRVLIAPIAALVAMVGAATAAAPSVTLSATPTKVKYGAATILSGYVTPAAAGQTVTIQAHRCGEPNFGDIGTMTTSSTGGFDFSAGPALNTTYRAESDGITSNVVRVNVTPRVALKKVAARKFRATLKAGLSFEGRYVVLQRLTRHGWLNVARITLTRSQQAPGSSDTITAGTKRVRIRHGVKVRAAMPAGVSHCYARVASRAITS